ncbi:SusD/RagB family nutrient-binding outer membrane lipoprotein [Rufibacter immobilis]|uniref:SusD/RagB family nutrient-binding outer membrane lipoprotein n=1 Tax=Rufibacter immobilis TaxID=1348778 RepID=A0A3M9MYE1_9BACT|nr:SusD/RagB family nutrient-binding outer membrane lipoprotein [Rufibacter immobilis]RNI29903.1 SusD/RagB family nutrient-binding outer membrane lipoprotein [Rufibacter immobilis]
MKHIRLFTLTLATAASLIASSCNDGFEELNQNPNTSEAATPETLLASAFYNVVTRNQNRALRLTNELMQVHVTTNNSDEIHRYVIRPSESDYMWNGWYLQRTNFLDMYQSAASTNVSAVQNRNFMGIALIGEVWVMSQLTDMFGDVPYTEANRGREFLLQPKFDAQKDIYVDLFRKLEEANQHFKANQTFEPDFKPLDPIYNGDITKWRKFGNSLYLRLLMRASGKPEVNAAAKINEIYTKPAEYPIFQNNDESAMFRFTTTPPYTSGFFNYRDFDFNGDNSLSEFFIDNLNNWNDPRLPLWATKSEGIFQGIPSGYKVGEVPPAKSRYLPALKEEARLGNIINYAEVQFILAEAAVEGFISADPKTFYDKGVEAGITMWGVPMPADYLTNPMVAWDAGANKFMMLEAIMLHKYYALFFTDFQQWHEYRRTGHPVLPKGEGLQNGGVMPSRFKYPVIVQSLNGANYNQAVIDMGGDDLNTKVWWNKP